MKKFFTMLAAVLLTASFGAETYHQAIKAGHQNRSKRKYAEALAAYGRAEKLATSPYTKWSAVFYTGVAQVMAKKVDEGIATLRKSLEIAPNEATRGQSQYHIGHYLMNQKKYDQAISELKKVAVVLKGKDPALAARADHVISRIYFTRKKYKEAYDLALATSKNKNKEFAFQAASTCFDVAVRIKDKAKAQAALDQMSAIAKGSKSDNFRFTILRQTYIYYSSLDRNWDKALDAAGKIANDKKFNKSYIAHGIYYKASIYGYKKQKDLAIAEWKKLENCGIKYFENAAKRNLKVLNKK